jgi:hypothetical protein
MQLYQCADAAVDMAFIAAVADVPTGLYRGSEAAVNTTLIAAVALAFTAFDTTLIVAVVLPTCRRDFNCSDAPLIAAVVAIENRDGYIGAASKILPIFLPLTHHPLTNRKYYNTITDYND